MKRLILICLAGVLGIGTAATVTLAADTTQTVTACATLPAQTVALNGQGVYTGTASTSCTTATYTVPTVTTTVTQTVSATTTTPTGPSCTRYASPAGSDANAGSSTSPYLTVQKLETSLTAGQTGCLASGSYGSTSSANAQTLTASGSSTAPITLTSADPASPAQVNGWLSITGDYVTVQDVRIDGANTGYAGPNACGATNVSQALDIEGTGDVLQYVDFTESAGAGNAIGIGFAGGAHGSGAIIRDNAIHDVGNCRAYDHLIYLSHGSGAQIYANWMWNDAHGFGVQVYPCPTNAAIHSNVIDGAASGFVVESDSGCTVSNDTITNNVVANSVGSTYIGSTGQGILTCCGSALSGDTFQSNDVFNNPAGVGAGAGGLTVSQNITTDPLFVSASTHNYALKAGSPAATYGLPAAVGPGAYRP